MREQALLACRRLLSQLNRDPATVHAGCFDRRYWAWKLVDFPEATFQRNVAPLCWYRKQPEVSNKQAIAGWIKTALLFTAHIQHRDGSFDQAYPYERSYGATAFLLPDLINAFAAITETLTPQENNRIQSCLRNAAEFLCWHREQHEFISNHLAGAALGLLKAHHLLQEAKYLEKSEQIVNAILNQQSAEGWFPEYGGADPGYQTLCMYYLAQIYREKPTGPLRTALERSLDFLRYFAHPDGTFGGEYGSRRTEIYYPGGIALLASEFPAAAALTAAMTSSIARGRTTTVLDVDPGNTAPLLSNLIMALEAQTTPRANEPLPATSPASSRYFKSAGIGIFSNERYYAVFGLSSGGTLKIFSKSDQKNLFDDGGMLGATKRGNLITSQIHDPSAETTVTENTVQIQSRLSFVPTTSPTPINYLLLRLANLTFMRISFLNEWVKKLLVKTLIKKDDFLPIQRTRRIEFGDAQVRVVEQIRKQASVDVARLRMGLKFSAIHMASARYFSPAQLDPAPAVDLDCETLNLTGTVSQSLQIDIETGQLERMA